MRSGSERGTGAGGAGSATGAGRLTTSVEASRLRFAAVPASAVGAAPGRGEPHRPQPLHRRLDDRERRAPAAGRFGEDPRGPLLEEREPRAQLLGFVAFRPELGPIEGDHRDGPTPVVDDPVQLAAAFRVGRTARRRGHGSLSPSTSADAPARGQGRQ